MLYQQGDVLIQVVDKIPADAVRLSPEQHRNTLAEGEATGHAHRVIGNAKWFVSKDVQGWPCGTGTYLDIGPKRIDIAHLKGSAKADHELFSIPPRQKVQIGRVREYDHFAEEARVVQD